MIAGSLSLIFQVCVGVGSEDKALGVRNVTLRYLRRFAKKGKRRHIKSESRV